MKKEIIAATFIHNTEDYSYPVDLWKSGLVDFETKIFESRKVEKPSDIAAIQNECLDELLKNYHHVLWVQADLLFIKGKTSTVMNHLGTNRCYGVESIKLFYYLFTTVFGCALVYNSRFVEDGAYLKDSIQMHHNVCAIDAGYIGEKNFHAHSKQQEKIWNQARKPIESNIKKIIIPNGVYKPIFDYYNLYDEYKKFING